MNQCPLLFSKERIPNINYYWTSLLIEELIRSGCTLFVVAPGSRSAPLAGAIANNEKAQYVMSFDERSAAFFALGHAKASGYPAALVVTSGTAVANLLPAVIEASLDRVPLLILSADRPPELRDIEANQSIDQVDFFAPYTRWSFDLPCPSEDVPPSLVLSTAGYAIYRSRHPNPGPVQINCMFREPLAPLVQAYIADAALEVWQKSQKPFTEYEVPKKTISTEALDKIAAILNGAKNGLIIAGANREKASAAAIIHLAQTLSWPIATDIASGLRQSDHPLIIRHDHYLWQHPEAKDFDFDVVLQFGGRLISKSLEALLKQRVGATHIFIADHATRSDPGLSVSHRIDTDIANFCSRLKEKIESNPGKSLRKLLTLSSRMSSFMANAHHESRHATEAYVALSISRTIAKTSMLMACTSMPIRDYHYFAEYRKDGGPTIVVNRGASGIDGLMSTAIGFARSAQMRSTVLIGDLAFLHDSNGLALLKQLNYPMTIVVINNQGGGIFSFLPIAAFKNILTPFIDAPHEHDLSGPAKTFGLSHYRVQQKTEFDRIYNESQSRGNHVVIEVKSERERNFAIHEKIKEQAMLA